MATNKHAVIRYRVIDQCLRKLDHSWNWKSLAEACSQEINDQLGEKHSFSERTIKSDIANMRNNEALGYFAPIDYDRRNKTYYYTQSDYSITEAPISQSEAGELKEMITLMRQFTGFKHLIGIENILHKLELLVYESTNTSKQIVQLEQPTVIPGQQWLDLLYTAIKDEKAVSIRYAPFTGKASNVIISPYLLKEYKGRWFLFALKHSQNELRTYGLERIQTINPSITDYRISKDFDPNTYFEDIVGITVDRKAKKKKIQFKVIGQAVFYIKTKPIHHSQDIISEAKNHTIFQIEVIPNYELESIFRSYGKDLILL